MVKCTNQAMLRKVTHQKLQKNTEVTFNINEDLETCVTGNAGNYVAVLGANPSYNRFLRPDDAFNCGGSCVNTGTLMVEHDKDSKAGQTIKLEADATEFVAGVITFYLYAKADGEYTVDVKIADMTSTKFTNADQYTKKVTVEKGKEGFVPVHILLSELPTQVIGDGWKPGDVATLLDITVTLPQDVLGIGFSSYSVFDSIEEFMLNEVVKLGCLDEIASDLTIDAIESACASGGLDGNSVGFEYNVVAKALTPNFRKLSPLYNRGEKITGHDYISRTFDVREVEIEGTNYGYVQLAGLDTAECGRVGIQIDDSCNVADSEMKQVSINQPTVINERQFNILPDGRVLFHESLAGLKMVIAYPKIHNAEHYEINTKNLEGRHTQMIIPFEEQTSSSVAKHGRNVRRGNRVFNNVYVTSFPLTRNLEESSFSFTIVIHRDENENFAEEFILTDEIV